MTRRSSTAIPTTSLIRSTALAAMAMVFAAASTAPAAAVERAAYSMEILIDGRPLAEYQTRGRTYVEALAGREYSVRLANRTGQRVAIALSVDGLNSIDAKTSSANDAAKWILGPYQTVTIDGWQTSSASARRFYFTTEQASYGTWLGETDNLGVIAAAVFRERIPPPILFQRRRAEAKPAPQDGRQDSRVPNSSSAPTERGDAEGKLGSAEVGAAPEPSDEMAATGIGRELDHQIEWVRFEIEPSPAAVLEARYEYRNELVRLGVLPRPCRQATDALSRRERARGFAETGFAPDPYRDGCR